MFAILGSEPMGKPEGTLLRMFASLDFQFLPSFGVFPRLGYHKYLGAEFLED